MSTIVGRPGRVDWVLFVALLAMGCGDSKKSDTGEACSLASDCSDPLSCSYGKCHATCVATSGCPQGQSCLMTSAGGVCQLPAEADCRTAACPAGLLCAVDYRCRSACQTAAGCTNGQVCLDGVCADPGDLDIEGHLPIKNPGPSNPGPQCEFSRDCAAFGTGYVCEEAKCLPAANSKTWGCLDRPAQPATGTVRMLVKLVDMLSQKPLAGVAVSLCDLLDSNCVFPLPPQYQSNPDGQVEFDLPAGFDGYLQTEGPGIYPTLIFLPRTGNQRMSIPTISLVPASFYPTMIKGVGTEVAEDRSLILVTALDCQGIPTVGVSLTSPQADSQTASFILAGGMPSRVAASTDESGGGGFSNIPAGGVLISATLAASNRLVGTTGVQARPGYVSLVMLAPNGS